MICPALRGGKTKPIKANSKISQTQQSRGKRKRGCRGTGLENGIERTSHPLVSICPQSLHNPRYRTPAPLSHPPVPRNRRVARQLCKASLVSIHCLHLRALLSNAVSVGFSCCSCPLQVVLASRSIVRWSLINCRYVAISCRSQLPRPSSRLLMYSAICLTSASSTKPYPR